MRRLLRSLGIETPFAFLLACSPAPGEPSPGAGEAPTQAPSQPTDIATAHAALDQLLDPKLIDDLRTGRVEAIELHHSLGRSIRNSWWGDSELATWFRDRGIDDAETMSSIILETYARRLRGQAWGVDELIAASKLGTPFAVAPNAEIDGLGLYHQDATPRVAPMGDGADGVDVLHTTP